MCRSKRRAILEVHRHGGDNHRRPGAPADAANIAEIPPEIVINRPQTRIVGRNPMAHEHLQALPLRRSVSARPAASNHVAQQLSDPRRFQPDAAAYEAQARQRLLKDGAWSVGPHHLVVAHVDDKQVGLAGRAVAGDLTHHVRVDRRHRGVDHLELHLGITLTEQHFQYPANAERPVGNALRRRLAKHEDAKRAGGLRRQQTRHGGASKRVGEESPAELQIAPIEPFGVGTNQEARRITVAPQPQSNFQ